MAFAKAVLIVPPLYCGSQINSKNQYHKVLFFCFHGKTSSRFCSSMVSIESHAKKTNIMTRKKRFNAIDTRIVENAQTKSSVEIPVTCY